MEAPFRKDLSHISWDEVYARQMQRASLVPEWMDAVGLMPGDQVLEVGSGPGYVTLVLAKRVGAHGCVYAIDRSPDALDQLERRQSELGISHIRRLVADAVHLEEADIRASSALITMVLHHADDARGILHGVHRVLPPHARIVLAEFHPDGPCEKGAPRSVRLAPEIVRAWCEEAGFHVLKYRRQSPEHYMLVAERVS